MATQKQIEANRRNARKSTGPRSASGKKRASRNALKHGLTTPISGAVVTREIEALARQIAGDPEDRLRMALARDAAEAQLDLDRVQRSASPSSSAPPRLDASRSGSFFAPSGMRRRLWCSIAWG